VRTALRTAIGGSLIAERHLSIGGMIGRGGYASVHKGTLTTTRPDTHEPMALIVAVKRIHKLPTHGPELTRLLREVALMHALTHPNLLRIIGVSASSECLSLITELMPRGSVYHWLHKECRGLPPPLPFTLRILVDTAAGLAHLHSRTPRVVHRDVKSCNLLLAADYSVRVADFGLSRECWSTQQMSRLGTVQYAAPEVLLGKPYSHKCDVWSYGVVCWELLTALVPFDGLSFEDVMRKVAHEGRRLPPPANTPAPLFDVMTTCWAAKPNKRPEFAKLHARMTALLEEQRAALAADVPRP